MSLEIDGFWKAGFWSTTFWADGFWREGAAPVVEVQRGGTSKRKKRRPKYHWEDVEQETVIVGQLPDIQPTVTEPKTEVVIQAALASALIKRKKARMLAAALVAIMADE